MLSIISLTHVVRAKSVVECLEVLEDAIEVSIELDELSFLVNHKYSTVVTRDELEGDVDLWQEPETVSLVDFGLLQYQCR